MTSPAATELPFHLRGNYAPVKEEITARDLPVEGAIPPGLHGLYVRNGPNPHTGSSVHWFAGDGMVHGVRLEKGLASWYRNRYVRTRSLEEDVSFVNESGEVDRRVGVSNTNVVAHAGKLFALVESSFPMRLGPELETRGVWDFERKLTTAMTAHPKLCPATGEMHFFGYGFTPPFLTYHRVDAAGGLVQSEVIEVPGPTMIHDFAITDRNVLFMDLPIVFSAELAMQGRFPYQWSDGYGARLGLMPRGGRGAEVRWFEIDPCYVFHPMNAFEQGDRVTLDVVRYPDLWRGGPESFTSACLHRFTIDPSTGGVDERPLDDQPIEFPRIDDRRNGLAYRFGYAAANHSSAAEAPERLIKYDHETGAALAHEFGRAQSPSEFVFVPASDGAGEDEGWLLGFVYDATRDRSDFLILDAHDFLGPPVARVRLPVRVPFGFHGNWVRAIA